MLRLRCNNVDTTFYQRCAALFRSCFNVEHWRSINVVSGRKSVVPILFHVQRRINVDSQLWNKVDPTLKCWVDLYTLTKKNKQCKRSINNKTFWKSIAPVFSVKTSKFMASITLPNIAYAFLKVLNLGRINIFQSLNSSIFIVNSFFLS